MRKLVSMGLVFAAACFWLACAGAPVKPTGPEILLPGEFIESVDANVILVKCTGEERRSTRLPFFRLGKPAWNGW